MAESTTIQIVSIIIGTGGSILGGIFALIKYILKHQVAQQKDFLQSQKEARDTFLTYIQKKNGNMERIAKDFSDASLKVTEALNKLTVEMALLKDYHDHLQSLSRSSLEASTKQLGQNMEVFKKLETKLERRRN